MLMHSLTPKAINQSLVYAALSTLVLGAIVQLHYSYLYNSILGGSYPYNIAPSIPETFLLLCALAVLYMLTLRYWFSLILISAVYCSFMWVSFLKITIFEAPLFPEISLASMTYFYHGTHFSPFCPSPLEYFFWQQRSLCAHGKVASL